MNNGRKPHTPIADLGMRILARHLPRRGFLRGRAPLVFRRPGSQLRPGMPPRHVCVPPAHYRMAVHLHLSVAIAAPAARRLPATESAQRFAVIRTLRILAAPVSEGRHAGPGVGMIMMTSRPSPALPERPQASFSPAIAGAAGPSAGPEPFRVSAPPDVRQRPAVPRTLPRSALVSAQYSQNSQRSRPAHTACRPTSIGGPDLQHASPAPPPPSSAVHEHRRHLVETRTSVNQISIVTRGVSEPTPPASRSVARDLVSVTGPASARASTTQALHMRTPVPVVPSVARQSWPDRRQDERPSLYAQPATRSLAITAPAAPAHAVTAEPGTTQRQAPAVQVQPPVIDVGRLSEDVYQHIQRRVRIERERRGL